MTGNFAGDHVTNDHTLGMAFDFDHIEHFVAVIHLHLTKTDLLTQRGIRTEEKLLSGLTTCIKCAGNLRATE